MLEGPLAGEEKGFSTSNYDDGIPLHLNFPDAFAHAIRESGIDLVSLANNHLLDMGVEGAFRTMDLLDEIGLAHLGAYRNSREKQATKVVEVAGMRLALLSYTFPSNNYPEEYFFEANKSITSIIVDRTSRYFHDAVAQVRTDFERARAERPDFIFVVAHMGTQFTHDVDSFQETWNEIFIQEGAHVILGDHSHAVQPVEFRSVSGECGERQVLIVNCPGNFVNSYVDYNGDATSIVKVYLDADTKSILCAGVIPMWTQSPSGGVHRALPVHDIIVELSGGQQISRYEMNRVADVYALVTEVMLGRRLTLDQVQNVHYLFPGGYHRQPVPPIDIDAGGDDGGIYALMMESETVVFVGDSVTEGTKNGGYGWFEPLVNSIPGKSVYVEASGGATTRTLLDKTESIARHGADLYVIAIGTTDVRYRDPETCAMTSQQYIKNLASLVEAIRAKNSNAKFGFVSPWPGLPNDPYTKVSASEQESMRSGYSQALRDYCSKEDHVFVDPSAKILSEVDLKAIDFYLIDHIHPNAAHGIRLYSRAVLAPD